METIAGRTELVDQLVQKLFKEYKTERNKFLLMLQFSEDQVAYNSDSELDYTVNYIAYKAGLLAWIKQYIIDREGDVFKAFRSCDRDGNADFYVSTDCIQILLKAENTISHIASRFTNKLVGLYELFQLDETNINCQLVSALEYAVHRKQLNDTEDLL